MSRPLKLLRGEHFAYLDTDRVPCTPNLWRTFVPESLPSVLSPYISSVPRLSLQFSSSSSPLPTLLRSLLYPEGPHNRNWRVRTESRLKEQERRGYIRERPYDSLRRRWGVVNGTTTFGPGSPFKRHENRCSDVVGRRGADGHAPAGRGLRRS